MPVLIWGYSTMALSPQHIILPELLSCTCCTGGSGCTCCTGGSGCTCCTGGSGCTCCTGGSGCTCCTGGSGCTCCTGGSGCTCCTGGSGCPCCTEGSGCTCCTGRRDGVKVMWCHSHLVLLVFEGSLPMYDTCSENFFVTCSCSFFLCVLWSLCD